MAKATEKQLRQAADLLKKHPARKRIFINVVSGHMAFYKTGALNGAKSPDDIVEYPEPAKEPAKDEPKKAAEHKASDAPVVIPEGEPSADWTKPQLVAYGKEHFPELKLMTAWKEETLLAKLAEAKAAQTPEA